MTALPAPWPTLAVAAVVVTVIYCAWVIFVRTPREEREAANRRKALGNKGRAR